MTGPDSDSVAIRRVTATGGDEAAAQIPHPGSTVPIRPATAAWR